MRPSIAKKTKKKTRKEEEGKKNGGREEHVILLHWPRDWSRLGGGVGDRTGWRIFQRAFGLQRALV
jgi:hypothetical protein